MQKKNLSDAFNEHKAKTEASQEAKASCSNDFRTTPIYRHPVKAKRDSRLG